MFISSLEFSCPGYSFAVSFNVSFSDSFLHAALLSSYFIAAASFDGIQKCIYNTHITLHKLTFAISFVICYILEEIVKLSKVSVEL